MEKVMAEKQARLKEEQLKKEAEAKSANKARQKQKKMVCTFNFIL